MPSSAPMTIGQATDLFALDIQNVFLKTSDPKVSYKKYFNFRTTSDLYEKDSSLSGLGESDIVDENASLISDVPVQGFDQTYTQEMFGLVLPFSFKMWKFGIKRRDLQKITTELKKADARNRERLCAERLDNGMSTSYTHSGPRGSRTITITGGDGLAAFTASHTREDGGTNQNNLVYDGTTYNLPFDYAGVKAAMRTAGLMVDPRGNPNIPNLNRLVCKTNSSVHFKAMEILKSIKDGKIPESNDNDGAGVNAFEIIPLDYLQNSAYWFMFDSEKALGDADQGFQFIESQAPMLDEPNSVYKTKEIQQSITSLFQLGHNDVTRCWVGSRGDSQA